MFTVRSSFAGLVSLTLIGALSAPVAADTAEGSATHAVAADGSGDFTTIGEAVAAAAEGDTILVRPGGYAEVLLIDKDITLKGDGPREQIILTYPDGALPEVGAPEVPGGPFVVVVRDADATLTGLTVSARRDGGSILMDGGSSLLHGNTLGALVRVSGAAGAEISFNTLLDFADVLVVDGASALVEDNDFRGGSVRVDGGLDVTVHGNVIRALAPVIGEPGVDVRGPGATAHIQGNVVSGSGIGISVADGASAFIEGNELRDNGIGIAWFAWQPGMISANSVCGASLSVWVTEGSGVEIRDAQDCEDEPAG